MAEWFRRNAGAVVFRDDKKVLICRRNDMPDSWQFPQGGIEDGETPAMAGTRELKEETSLEGLKRIITLDEPARYYFPAHIKVAMQSRGYTNAGQDMYWSLFYFSGDDSQINLQTENPEFVEYKWVSLDDACALAVDFKKNAYEFMRTKFAPLIAGY